MDKELTWKNKVEACRDALLSIEGAYAEPVEYGGRVIFEIWFPSGTCIRYGRVFGSKKCIAEICSGTDWTQPAKAAKAAAELAKVAELASQLPEYI